MKYAIVSSGGKQYIAREGEPIEVDRMQLEIGAPVEFKEVLLAVDGSTIKVGTPLIKGASVKGKVLDQVKAKKIIVFKYIPKERYRRKKGHRQQYTRVSIDKIPLASAEKKATSKKETAKAEKPPAKTTTKKAASTAKKSTAKVSKKETGTSKEKKSTKAKSTKAKSTSTKTGSKSSSTGKKSTTKE
ncbi:MAG: 50S ribosomal protein L21 [Anaerolineales bacterium]|nr:50S ribosomal protein L21 [Anaerolineales bacterium]